MPSRDHRVKIGAGTNQGENRMSESTSTGSMPVIAATPITGGRTALVPVDFESAWRIASVFARSGQMVPEIYRENPEACMAVVMWGMEIGVTPIQAIQGIAVINGRASVWGDLLLALAVTHPDFVDCTEERLVSPTGEFVGYRVTTERRNRKPVVREFTLKDGINAGLIPRAIQKGGPWKDYPERMCLMRARGWSIRDCMPDALRGLYPAEEAADMLDVTPGTARNPIREPRATTETAAGVDEPAPAQDAEFTEEREATQATPAIEHQPPDEMLQTNADMFAQAVDAKVAAERVDDEPASKPATAPAAARVTDLSITMRQTLDGWVEKAVAAGMTPMELDEHIGGPVTVGSLAKAIAYCRKRCGQ